MRNIIVGITILWLLASCSQEKTKVDTPLKHLINASIDVNKGSIAVADTLLNLRAEKEQVFYLNKNLKINKNNKDIQELGFDENIGANKYAIKAFSKINGVDAFVLSYSGTINEGFEDETAEYARGFNETNGIISDSGVYLSGSSYWLPTLEENRLSSFNLNLKINKGWGLVTQGIRTLNKEVNGQQVIRYECKHPMDDIYLIAAQWTEYEQKSDHVVFQAFLRTPDEEMANNYLSKTQEYLELYESLIGPYPYSKFALVENFWETGYGMPSFTLLGPQVIRFPWILYTSYPHELLHNYWGNGVFVDTKEGNWCEGITAYMADHLMKEQRGQGANYRRSSLQKFTNYVNEGNDFLVKDFINRNNSAQEAVGYGKVLMMNEMLRNRVGDSLFLEAYRKFYKDNEFTKVGFNEIRLAFEAVSGVDFKAFFKQWIYRTGAPKLELQNVNSTKKENGKYLLSWDLLQFQKEEAFAIDIPVFVFLNGVELAQKKVVRMNKKTQHYEMEYDALPLRIEIDPQFNVMRRLHSQEIPPSLGQLFGEEEITIIIPANSKLTAAYQTMAETWKTNAKRQELNAKIITDNSITELPDNRSVWVLGSENKFNPIKRLLKEYKGELVDKISQIEELAKSGSLVFSIPAKSGNSSVGFVAANDEKAIPALTRKLPHYGKYSLLGFETEKATNVLKHSMSAQNSPLNYSIPYENEYEILGEKVVRGALK